MTDLIVPETPRRRVGLAEAREQSRLLRITKDSGAIIGVPGALLFFLGLVLFFLCNASLAIGLVAGVSTTLLGVGLFCLGVALDPGKPMRTRLAQRRMQQLNAGLPWEPVEGDTHPVDRDDTYARFTVDVRVEGEDFAIGLQRWTIDSQRVWSAHRVHRPAPVRVAREDAQDLPEAVAAARIDAEAQQLAEANAWAQGRTGAQIAAASEAEAQQMAQEAAERLARDRRLAALLSG